MIFSLSNGIFLITWMLKNEKVILFAVLLALVSDYAYALANC